MPTEEQSVRYDVPGATSEVGQVMASVGLADAWGALVAKSSATWTSAVQVVDSGADLLGDAVGASADALAAARAKLDEIERAAQSASAGLVEGVKGAVEGAVDAAGAAADEAAAGLRDLADTATTVAIVGGLGLLVLGAGALWAMSRSADQARRDAKDLLPALAPALVGGPAGLALSAARGV